MYWPATAPRPGTMLTTPSGRPASRISSAIFSDVSGVISAGFITMRVAGGERRRHLPAGEHQREVPRHHLADHADRLAQRVVEKARLDRNGLALELVGHAAEVAEARRGARHVERARVAQRVAGVERLEARELLGIGFDQVGQLQQDAPAIGRGHAAPRREGALVAAATARSTSAAPASATSAMVELSCGFSVASVSPSIGVDEVGRR